MVDYVPDGHGHPHVRVVCDDCGRSVMSDTLMDDEICALVGWTFDFGAVVCVLCQKARGQPPILIRMAGP